MVIKKHTKRLKTIIEDLLMLSQIEKDCETRDIQLEEPDVWPTSPVL